MIQLAFLLSIFLAVGLASYGVLELFTPRPVRKRLESIAQEGGEEAAVEERPSAVAKFLARIGERAVSKQPERLGPTRLRFYRAGIRSPIAPAAFYGLKLVLAIAPVVAFGLLGISGGLQHLSLTMMLLLLLLVAIGYFLPDGILARLTEHRQLELFHAFPDALDLIRVCVEAGLSLDAAIQRVGKDIRLESPELAEELYLVSLELRAGASRADALRNLAQRVDLEDVDGLVSMLLQSDRFGTSIAEALRVHSEALRRKRRLIAEERAAKLPVKLLFPLVFCIFPALLAVLLAPAWIAIYRTLLPVIGASH